MSLQRRRNGEAQQPCYGLVEQQKSAEVLLSNRNAWAKLASLDHEMLISKFGKILYPPIGLHFANLNPDTAYLVQIEFKLDSNYQMTYDNNKWTPSNIFEPHTL
ncbi:MAG: Domain first found in the mice T locus (Brachyury) protein, partial [Paramarteilia canceri]